MQHFKGSVAHPVSAVEWGEQGLEWPSAEAAAIQELQDFVTYWKARVGADGLPPPRSSLDPLELPPNILGRIILSEREEARLYRYRLFGTQLRAIVGRELTGHLLDEETMDGSLHPFLDMLEAVVTKAEPIFLSASLWWEGRSYRKFHQVTVPFRRDNDPVTSTPGIVCTLVHFS